ncbi:hypothetical protein GQ457_08G025180 [Hibiscus cannabinus]
MGNDGSKAIIKVDEGRGWWGVGIHVHLSRRIYLQSLCLGGATANLRLEKLLIGALKDPLTIITTVDGVATENDDYEIFVTQGSALASWLLSTIIPQLLSQFIGVETAPEIWFTVLRFLSSRSTTTVMRLHFKFISLKKGDLSMCTYVSHVKEFCNALATCGSLISDLEMIVTILNDLPMEYQPFLAMIMANHDLFTLDAAVSMLFDAETQLNNLSGRGRYGRMRIQCQLCWKLSHLVDCYWHRFDESFLPVTICNNDQVKSEPNLVNLCALDTDSPSYVCSCADPINQGIVAGHTLIQPQVHLTTDAEGQWFIDSGTSHHVSPDSLNLFDSVDYFGPGKLNVGNGMHLDISMIVVHGVERLWRAVNSSIKNVTPLCEPSRARLPSDMAALDVVGPSSLVGATSTCQAPFISHESSVVRSSPASLLPRYFIVEP